MATGIVTSYDAEHRRGQIQPDGESVGTRVHFLFLDIARAGLDDGDIQVGLKLEYEPVKARNATFAQNLKLIPSS